MADVKLTYKVYRDYFTEAQPENTMPEVWMVEIVDADTGEVYDFNTGYATEQDAIEEGKQKTENN